MEKAAKKIGANVIPLIVLFFCLVTFLWWALSLVEKGVDARIYDSHYKLVEKLERFEKKFDDYREEYLRGVYNHLRYETEKLEKALEAVASDVRDLKSARR